MPSPRYRVPGLVVLVLSCASAPPPPPAKVETPPPAPRLEKVREPLEVLPLELFFSGVRGEARASESVTIRNTGNDPVQIDDLVVVGSQAGVFKVTGAPPMPALLRANGSISLSVDFAPGAAAEPGVYRARLRIARSSADDGPPCDLSALVTKGTDLGSEPQLPHILETLGYAADVGFLGAAAAGVKGLTGSEVAAPLLRSAKPGNVGLYVIARYAPDEPSSYGTYTLDKGKPVEKPLGTIAAGQNQTLNPELDGEGQTSFDPGAKPFGIFVKLGSKGTLYSEDQRNTGTPRHAMRVYPLRSRGGASVTDHLLVAADQDGDGDFQDYVFMLVNAQPAP
jgi:hypothetical protein